jgi:hypothetical protein
MALKALPASVALTACLCMGAAPAGAATRQAAPPRLAPTAKLAHVAHPVRPTTVWSRPGGGHLMWRTPAQTAWNGGPVSLLVLGSRAVHGTLWLEVRLPIRPNTAAGWVNSNFVTMSATEWRVVVHTAVRWVDVYRSGRKVRGFAAVVGKGSTPTPHGLFAVWEKIPEPDVHGFLGPWALHLTAHSNVLFNFGGGPGRVAIHGRDGASLLDPLGTADSHGCVRVLNQNVIWLAEVLNPGDPVLVTN